MDTAERRATLEQAEIKVRSLGRMLIDAMPKGWGFSLILWSFGGPGFSTYVSNANRTDMVKALREFADKLERGEAQA